MSKRKNQPPPQTNSGVLRLEITADMREFDDLVAAAQSDVPAKRLAEIVDWHEENQSEYAGDVAQKAKALLAAKALLNGYGGFGKLVPPIRGGASGHSKKADDQGAQAESEPQHKS